METQFNYARLKDLIETSKYYDDECKEIKKYNKKTFAKAIGISYYSLYKKLNNIVPFNQTEIIKIVEKLKINHNEISEYFFTEKVKKTQF